MMKILFPILATLTVSFAAAAGAFSDTLVSRLLRLADGETPLTLIPVGRSPRS